MSPSKHTAQRDSTVAHRNALVPVLFNAYLCLEKIDTCSALFQIANQRTLPTVQLSQSETRKRDRQHICCESDCEKSQSNS